MDAAHQREKEKLPSDIVQKGTDSPIFPCIDPCAGGALRGTLTAKDRLDGERRFLPALPPLRLKLALIGTQKGRRPIVLLRSKISRGENNPSSFLFQRDVVVLLTFSFVVYFHLGFM